MIRKSCGNCFFFAVADPNRGAGYCHRYPRTVAVDSDGADNYASLHPRVTTRDWCGEHRPVDAAPSIETRGDG